MNTENNRIIAEFMGWESNRYSNLPGRVHKDFAGEEYGRNVSSFEFDSNWNEIMPVFEKIATIPATNAFIINNGCIINGHDRYKNEPVDFVFKEESTLHAVYKAVVEFIKWYNTQPK